MSDSNISVDPNVPDGEYEAHVLITKITVFNGQADITVSNNHRYHLTYEGDRLFLCHLYIPDSEKHPNWPHP